MSMSGVPSRQSSPLTSSLAPSRRSRCATAMPMGLGRWGERVANTPRSTPSCGVGLRSVWRGAWCSQYSTCRCEACSMPSSASSKAGSISSQAGSPRPRTPRGQSCNCRQGVRTRPMGRSVKASFKSGVFMPPHYAGPGAARPFKSAGGGPQPLRKRAVFSSFIHSTDSPLDGRKRHFLGVQIRFFFRSAACLGFSECRFQKMQIAFMPLPS